ncbi:MAG: helix-turn-helix transcriptional regulator [Gemmatimonadetes bacterium]|nr:helix-turn-helix transcriptional regulator [Gemmatimonadota bacterium]
MEHLRAPDSAAGVARQLRLPRQKVNYHLRELEKHGLVRLVRESTNGNGTERRVEATAKSFALNPRMLGRLAPDRVSPEPEDPTDQLLAQATRTLRQLGALLPEESPHDGDDVIAIEAELRFRDDESFHAFAGEIMSEIDRLAEKYRDPNGRVTRLTLGLHPRPAYGGILPPPGQGARENQP